MFLNKNRQPNLCKKWAVCTLFALFLSVPVFAQDNTFGFDNIAQAHSNKLYLYTSRTEKTVPNTFIPFNLRQFDESDYFSSAIEDSEADTTIKTGASPPPLNLNSVPVPSEFTASKQQIKNDVEVKVPDSGNNQFFFAPLPDDSEKKLPQKDSGEAFFAENESLNNSGLYSQDNYKSDIFAVSTEEDNSFDSEFEGKLISDIKIVGLKTLKPDFLMDKISTQLGSIFNSAILQKDLQTIYSTGYFTDVMSVEPKENKRGSIELVFTVEENLIIKKVVLYGNTVFAESELTSFVNHMNNRPQNLQEINNAVENITNYYHDKGYVLARISSVDDTSDGELSFTIQEGVIDKINIAGNERTKDYVITRNIMTQPGTVYNEEYLMELADVLTEGLVKQFYQM